MIFSSQTLFMLHHKVSSSQIRTLWVRSTWSHRFVIDLNFQTSWCILVWLIHSFRSYWVHWVDLGFNLGATDMNSSVTPSCSNHLRFCISVPLSRSTRSHQYGQDIYTHRSIFGNSFETLRPRVSCFADSSLRIISSSPATSCYWSLPPSTWIFTAVAAIASSSPS